jgi:uncharacterized protein YprB with RNaseH-like and TPR domain
MDILKKLEYYKSAATDIPVEPAAAHLPESSKLAALRDHFNAEILQPQSPCLKIVRKVEWPLAGEKNPLRLDLLSRRQFTTEIELEKCLFFDLETTGLAGGAGTFAFLIGFAFVRNNVLIIQQYFLPDYGREYYLFKELQDFISSFHYLVSYNGKTFDAPLLTTRFVLNRFEAPFRNMEHIDILHIARRIWKDSYDSCDLQTLESRILNRPRSNDIPGYLIPQAYFDFLRSEVIHSVIQIIDHNNLDLQTLAELTLLLGRVEQSPELISDVPARMRLANLAYELDDPEYFNKVCQRQNGFVFNERCQLKLWESFLHKRRGNWQLATQLWDELIQTAGFSFVALEELAKFYEHISRDHQKALEYTQRALRTFQFMEDIEAAVPTTEMRIRFEHRQKRLISKLS